MSAEALSRRAALRAGALAVAGMATVGGETVRAAALDDPALLRLNVGLEQTIAAAAEAALAGPLLRRRRAEVTALGRQERAHAALLSGYLRVLGGRPPRPPVGMAAAAAIVPGLATARAERDVLAGIAELLRVAVRGWYDAIFALYDQKLVQAATAIMCDESQHLAVLRDALGREPLPFALESGLPEP